MEDNTPLIRPALVPLAPFTLFTGVVYPLAVWGIGQAAFPRQANGTLVEVDGRILAASWWPGPWRAWSGSGPGHPRSATTRRILAEATWAPRTRHCSRPWKSVSPLFVPPTLTPPRQLGPWLL